MVGWEEEREEPGRLSSLLGDPPGLALLISCSASLASSTLRASSCLSMSSTERSVEKNDLKTECWAGTEGVVVDATEDGGGDGDGDGEGS